MEIKGVRQEASVNYDKSVGAWFGASQKVYWDEMLSRVFRFDQLPSNDHAFIDAAISGPQPNSMGALGRGTAEEDLAPSGRKSRELSH